MDLVKIGFVVSANGLKDANTQVDALLTRVDSIGTKGKKAASDFESSQKKTKDSVKKTGEEVDKTTKALERQRLIGDYLTKGLDRATATSLANFKQLGGTASQINDLMTSLVNNKGIIQAQKAVEDLEKARQKRFAAVQIEYQKTMELIKSEAAAQKAAAQKVIDDAEKARVKRFSAEQDQYQKNMELLARETAAKKAAAQKAIDDAEKARQKKFSAVQKEYQQNMERLARQTAAEKAAQEKSVQAAEKARQMKFAAVQKHYQQQMELLANQTAAEKAAQEKATQNAEKERQKQIAAAERARQAELRGQATPSTRSGTFDQIKGIAAYALLSTAIYGAMTATFGLIAATIKMADEYTSTQQRLKLYIKDAKTLGEVNTFLAKSAIQNNVGLRENAALYAKLAPAMQRIGANTAATNMVVDAFGKSLRIGGATAMEAASATIQFAQAMASGKLAGDEFRSISEASPRFLKAIADGSGIAAEKLKEMSSAGALTTEVIARALVKEYHNLTKESESLGYTLEQGTNALKTGFMSLVGEFNEGAGITKYLGELMAGMGVDMIDSAESAKQSGESFKAWFVDNADNINTLMEMFKALSIVIVSRYVAALVIARYESMKLTWQTSALAAAQTNAMRAFVIGATAVTAFGRAASAASAAFTFMGGWAGILLTLAGVAATYLILRDNAAEATQKLVEQSKYVDITTEAYQRLNKEQQLNARSSVVNDMNDVNKKLDEQANAVERVLKSYAMSRQFSGLGLDAGTKDVLDKVTKGVISYDTALRLLSENKNIPKNIVDDFKKERDVYNETAKNATRFADAAKVVGYNTELAGNKAQNATPLIKGLSDKTSELGDKADIAGSKVGKFATDLKKAIQDSKDTYDLMNRFDLDEMWAKKLVDRVNQQFAGTQGGLDKAKEKIETAQKELNKLDANNPQRKYVQERISLAKEELANVQKIAEQKKKSLADVDAPLVQQAQKEAERVSELSASRRKADKEADKARKKQEADAERLSNANQKIVDKYDNQEATAIRLNEYLKAGVAYSVAKVASEGKYAKVYGDNLETARKIAKARQEVADIEESSKGREDSQNSLMKNFRDQQAINDFMKEGYSYAVAQATVQSGFAVNADGIANANNRTLISLREQLSTSVAEANYQQDLLDFVKSGLSVEEASAKVAIYRNKNLNQGLIITAEELAKAKQTEQVTKSQIALELESNSYKEQATYLVQTTNNELADIMAKYKGVSLQEAQTLQTRKDIVDKLTEYNNLLEKQRTLAYDIENVNFEVFGDFGNPFKSALEGLNSLLFGMSDLEAKYQRMGADLTARIGKEKKGSEAQKLLIAEKADLELAHIQESKQARDKAITSGLSITKSLFKEESKGYKVVSGLEKAYQASKIAFALWEKKDTIKTLAIKVAGYAKDMITFIGGVTSKVAAQMGLNVVQAQGAVASAAQAPPPVGFASAAAMIALLAGIGIAISGGGGGSYVDTSNQGTGTVFGDTEAKSASIKNSIDILSDNSDLMLPLTSAMLASLRNIESSIGGVTNLILRQATGGEGFNIQEGFNQNGFGKALANPTVGALGGLLGGGALGATVGVSALMGGLGMGAMGALAIAGPIGLAVGALLGPMLGKVLGGLFGTKTTINASGLFGGDQKLGDILSEGFNLQEYIDIQTKKKTLGITTSNKFSTKYSKADAELSNQFTLIFGGFYDSILSATDILGADMNAVKTNLENAVISIGKINLKGLSGDEIQEKLEAVFGAAADSLAKQAFGSLEDFQTVGEGYFETLVKVASAVEEAAYYTDRLNVTAINYNDIINKQADDLATEIVRQSYLTKVGISTVKGGMTDLVNSFDGTAEEITDFISTLEDLQEQLFMTGKSGNYLTSSMILGAGGLDKLSSGLDAYFEMLSPAEQAAELTRRLTKEFAIFGKELPSDVKAFRNLVNSIDVSTEAGQKLYGQIIALAPEFNDLQDSIKSANSEVNALVQSLRDLAEQARGARGETDQTRNLASIRSEFDRVSALAMQGDIAAANRLVELGKDLMGVSKTYATSNEDYARDLSLIQRAATVAADLQANGLGTTVTPTLTTTAGTAATPTIETTNASMTTEMKTMREELNAGLFAIAKFVQNIDSRTDRWDDGNRVMVGVLPEVGDNPQPVTVV